MIYSGLKSVWQYFQSSVAETGPVINAQYKKVCDPCSGIMVDVEILLNCLCRQLELKEKHAGSRSWKFIRIFAAQIVQV